ncbi:MAG: hypothetical protein J0H54_13515, partial [Rhizobiales bacterium]|nr:hypothetical protein [Hyphomicrobiales bacterium]
TVQAYDNTNKVVTVGIGAGGLPIHLSKEASMAVVTKYGNGYPAPGALVAVDALDAEASVKCIYSKISIANGDSANSKLYLGRVPSNARILPSSTLYHEGVTSVNDFDVGFDNDADALVDGADISTAGTKSLVSAIATGNLGKRAWEMAGLASDPGGRLDVFATMKVAATAAKVIEAFIYYAKK